VWHQGLLLLGDAAGFLDPITGGGMTQALMTAELLDRHIPDRVSEDDSWLWKFEPRARPGASLWTIAS